MRTNFKLRLAARRGLIAAALAGLICSAALSACSTGVNGTVNVGLLTVSPTSLSLGCNGQPKTQTVVSQQAGFNGQFSAQSSNTAVATVQTTTTPGQFTVTETGAGQAVITVTGGAGATANVAVTGC